MCDRDGWANIIPKDSDFIGQPKNISWVLFSLLSHLDSLSSKPIPYFAILLRLDDDIIDLGKGFSYFLFYPGNSII
jgi:hypothetical protein